MSQAKMMNCPSCGKPVPDELIPEMGEWFRSLNCPHCCIRLISCYDEGWIEEAQDYGLVWWLEIREGW